MIQHIATIGNIEIGGNSPIKVQTMCNTHTTDIDLSIEQCIAADKAGADLIRLTTQGIREVEALAQIKKRLRENKIDIPIVADVHFNAEVAIAAAKVADKVRINPGNFAKDFNVAKERFKELLSICKENKTAIRIGLNHGSLGERIINLYGDTPLGMKEAAMEWIKMCKEENFSNIVISLKSSNTYIMVEAYKLLYSQMQQNGELYPIHLGVTEAGNGESGRIKSAVGIASLLSLGIGDTIRVSLTENPINEIPVGKKIADYFDSLNYIPNKQIIEQSITNNIIPSITYNENSWEDFIIKASSDFGPYLLNKSITDFKIQCYIGEQIICNEKIEDFKDNLLQASRRKFTKPEYIACPGCGRTQYNLEETFNKVKEKTSHLKGVKIAVMGCIVNGPGEMADADYGYVGEGKGRVAIYKGKEPLLKSVPQEEAIEALLKIIEEDRAN